MTAIEKIYRYISGHKRPVTVVQLQDYFLLSPATVRQALNELHTQGKLEVLKFGRQPYGWRIARMAIPSAPAPAPAPRRATYNRPIQNSYPHSRGYDD